LPEKTSQNGPGAVKIILPRIFSNALVSLNIISTGDILPIAGRDEVTLGRISEGQLIIPDIDLTPYKAYNPAYLACMCPSIA
jgi:hypothetical protein